MRFNVFKNRRRQFFIQFIHCQLFLTSMILFQNCGPSGIKVANTVTSRGLATTSPGIISAAPWAAAVVSGPGSSQFISSVIDSSGNVYAFLTINANGTYDFGNNVTVNTTTTNRILIKYNNAGVAQWARAMTAGGLGVDSAGNLYLAAELGQGTFSFGNGVSVTTPANGTAVLLKMNSAGVAQWAQSVVGGASGFGSVAFDINDNIILSGLLDGSSFNFGNGVTLNESNVYCSGVDANGVTFSVYCLTPFIAKYNPSGVAQWAKTVVMIGASHSDIKSIKVDKNGNIYGMGTIWQGTPQPVTESVDFGNGVKITGYGNYVIKFDANGVAQWAQTSSPMGNGIGGSLALDASGNVIVDYLVGNVPAGTNYNFGNGVSANTAVAGLAALVVKYNPAGVAQWAQPVVEANNLAVDASGNVYVAGYLAGTVGSIGANFGNGVTATMAASAESFIVKFNSAGVAQSANIYLTGNCGSYTNGFFVGIDTSANVYAYGCITGTSAVNFAPGLSISGSNPGYTGLFVKL